LLLAAADYGVNGEIWHYCCSSLIQLDSGQKITEDLLCTHYWPDRIQFLFLSLMTSEEQWQEDGNSPEAAASTVACQIRSMLSQFASDVVVLISAGVTLLNTPKRNIPKEVLEDIKSLQIKSPLGSTSVAIMEKLELAIFLAYQGFASSNRQVQMQR
jgi:hypothetical protein